MLGTRLLFHERDCNPIAVDGCLAVRQTDEWLFNAGALVVWAIGAILIVAACNALRDSPRDDSRP